MSYFLQSWEGFQSPIPFMSKTPPSPFSQTRTWCGGPGYAMEGKIKRPFNLLMFHMLTSQNSWKVNKGIQTPSWNGMFTKTFQSKRMSNNQLSKTTSSIRGKCRNPTLAKCGGEAQHLEKLEVRSLPGLPNVQSSTTRGKTPRIGVFLVSLERS